MEGSQRKLCTRFPDGLCRDHTNGFSVLYHFPGGEIPAITLGTDPFLGLTGQHRPDLDLLQRRIINMPCDLFRDFLSGINNQVACQGMIDIMNGCPAEYPFIKGLHGLLIVLDGGGKYPPECSTIKFRCDHVL